MIELQNICKSYKVARRSAGLGEAVKSLFRREYTRVDALSDVSFTVRDGEMVGYIGPNGAGKSSTIKIMSGVLTPDSGTCVINGRVPWKERTAHVQEIGVVFGQRSQLWWDVPVADSFELLRDIYRVDGAAYRKTLSRLTELLELGELLRTLLHMRIKPRCCMSRKSCSWTSRPSGWTPCPRRRCAALSAYATKSGERPSFSPRTICRTSKRSPNASCSSAGGVSCWTAHWTS